MILAEEVYYRAMRLVRDIATSPNISKSGFRRIKLEAESIVQEGKEALVP